MGCSGSKVPKRVKKPRLKPISGPSYDYSQNGKNWKYKASGRRQTPINIVTDDCVAQDSNVVEVDVNDVEGAEVIYNHNQLQVNYDQSTLKLTKGDKVTNWKALQFHFHAPCEHTIDSVQHDVEFHLVHVGVDEPGQLLVLGIMFEKEEGATPSEFIESLKLENLPAACNNLNLKINDMVSKCVRGQKFNYPGSLTTPPCSEIVEWVLVKETLKVPPEQIKLFTRLWAENPNFAGGKGNNRCLQNLAGRTVNLI